MSDSSVGNLDLVGSGIICFVSGAGKNGRADKYIGTVPVGTVVQYQYLQKVRE